MPSEGSPFGHSADCQDFEQQRQYDRLAKLYESGLGALGSPITCLEAPSIYQTNEARRAIEVVPPSAHLAVRPIAAFRPFYGVPNYIVFDGPAGDLDHEVPGSLRSADDILKAATGVFCTTALLTDALLARGICNATTLPPPMATDATSGDKTAFLQEVNAIALDGASPVTISSLLDTTRASGGQIIYWDAGEASDVDGALGMVLDAADVSGMPAANCILVIAGFTNPPIGPKARALRQSVTGIYRVEKTLDHDEKQSLARECDIFIRATISEGLDLNIVAAVRNGVWAIVPQGHSAIEPIGSHSVSTYRPELTKRGWGSRSRQRCPDLIRALKEALELPPAGRAPRPERDWVQTECGIRVFADRLRAEVGTL